MDEEADLSTMDKICPRMPSWPATHPACPSCNGDGDQETYPGIGMHFFQPVPVMAMVEIVKTIASPGTVETAEKVSKSLGKQVVFAKDTPASWSTTGLPS
jgi:hypothetical protein